GKVCNAGDVATGPRKAFHQAYLNRIDANPRHNDGNCLGRILGGPGVIRTTRNDDVNFETDQLIRQGGKPVGFIFSESRLDGYILALNVTERTKLCLQCRGPMRGTGKSPGQKTYPVNFSYLLCLGG